MGKIHGISGLQPFSLAGPLVLQAGNQELTWDLLYGLKCAEVVHKLKEKELLKFECKKLQIRQIGVNGDPPDPMLAGACVAWCFIGCCGVPLNDFEGRLVAILEEKELLKFECKKLLIRQVGVNGDPPDPMLAGACVAWFFIGCCGVPLNDLEGRLVAILEGFGLNSGLVADLMVASYPPLDKVLTSKLDNMHQDRAGQISYSFEILRFNFRLPLVRWFMAELMV
ncbi:hypothetical protein F2Q70_00031148 [Brassica cretica]|uniref:Uncharacterized protein n=1 Tax=Brassica cretica TaxID=69181 RepID=A0A8S9FJS0_BRACR|nr:hypothetical protein F2Q70_00031148 [Brassica cretica]